MTETKSKGKQGGQNRSGAGRGDTVRGSGQAATRQALLDAALEVFAAKGYRGASLQEVAERAGVTKPTVYSYFKNKADLYEKMVLYVHEQFMSGARAALEGKSGTWDRVSALLEYQYDFVRQHSALLRLFHSTMFLPENVQINVNPVVLLEERYGLMLDVIREGLERGEIQGDMMDIGLALSGLGSIGFVQALMPSVPILQPGLAQRLWGLLYDGIRRRNDGDQ